MYNSNRLPSQTSASSFELPQNRYLQINEGNQQPQGQDGGAALPLPAPADNLAHVEGLTDKYYDTWGKLQAYTHAMHKDYGLDVTAPDYSQPGGGLPFKTYQKLTAALMNTANTLGNKMKEQTQMRPYKATGQVTGSGEDNDSYVSTQLSPEVQDMQKAAADTFYTSRDAKRAYDAHIAPRLAELEQRAASGDPYWKRQLEIAKGLATSYQTHPSFFKPQEDDEKAKRKAMAKAAPELGVLKKLTADKNGAWQKGSFSMKTDPSTGKAAAFNPELEGKHFGDYVDAEGKTKPLIIAGLYRRPDKTTWVSFKGADGEEAQPPRRIDNMAGDEFTALIQQSNPTFGKASNTSAAIQILGHQDIGGTVDEQSLFGEDHPAIQQRQSDVDSFAGNADKVDTEKERIKTGIESLKGLLPGNNDFKIGNITIHNKRFGSGYYIDGDKSKTYTIDEILNKLDNDGYFNDLGATSKEDADKAKAADLIKKFSNK